MSKIISIGTAIPAYQHSQEEILGFMQLVYAMNEGDKRRMKYLYSQSGIDTRYSVIPDYSRDLNEWKFYPQSENLDPFPSLELRMTWYNKLAGPLSVDAIRNCLMNAPVPVQITHLITVSCTGMSAPGLDLQIMDLLDLPKNCYRTSVNFMGCYAGIHALKIADAICKSNKEANVMIVCTELCTIHFQRESTMDNITSSLLFGDGAAALLVCADDKKVGGMHIDGFYSEILTKGKRDMAWELSSSGFLMTLSGFIPQLIEEDFAPLVTRALHEMKIVRENISDWCIHPGGKRILDAIYRSLGLTNGHLSHCYDILREFGNMSSPTIFFVLKKIMEQAKNKDQKSIFAAAFGPGLTMETFTCSPT